jgi:predicted DNA-binding transcriptional regulator AlpA
MYQLPATGYLRLAHIVGNPNASPPIPALIPVSKSTWWAGVKSGRYPQPVRALGRRITAWRVEDIVALIRVTADTGAAEYAGDMPAQ